MTFTVDGPARLPLGEEKGLTLGRSSIGPFLGGG